MVVASAGRRHLQSWLAFVKLNRIEQLIDCVQRTVVSASVLLL